MKSLFDENQMLCSSFVTGMPAHSSQFHYIQFIDHWVFNIDTRVSCRICHCQI